MLYRVVAVAIVSFWLVMMGLLVRTEFFPSASDLLPVPVDHLFRVMFLHEQPSDLVVFQDEERIGDIHLRPHRFPHPVGGARNALGITGSLTLHVPGLDTRFLTLRGTVEIDDQDTTRHFDLTVAVHEPVIGGTGRQSTVAQKNAPNLTIVFDGDPPRNRYHYLARQGEAVLGEQTGSPAELLDQPVLSSIGLSPAVLSSLAQQQAASAEIKAHRGFLHTKGGDIETYDLTLRQGDVTTAIVQLSQLGNVLAVQTSSGYSLLDESLAQASGSSLP